MLLNNRAYLTFSKILIVAIAILTMYMFFFGFLQSESGMNGQTKCPFSDHSMSVCNINPMEHIEEWQNLFTTLPVKGALAFLSLILVLFILFRLRQISSLLKIHKTDSYINLFDINRPPIFDSFKEAFSSGIINPKTF